MTKAELVAKVARIIETVSDRPFAAEIIVDVVLRSVDAKGGRPTTRRINEVLETSENLPSQGNLLSGSESSSGSGSPRGQIGSSSKNTGRKFLEFPVDGRDGPTWWATEELADDHQTAFPSLNVRIEYRKALAWVNANQGRRKTSRGMPAFLFNWLTKAQNMGPRLVAVPPPAQPRTSLCQWHADWRNENKPAHRYDANCPECRHVAAKSKTPSQNEPVAIGDVFGERQ